MTDDHKTLSVIKRQQYSSFLSVYPIHRPVTYQWPISLYVQNLFLSRSAMCTLTLSGDRPPYFLCDDKQTRHRSELLLT